MLKQLKKVGLSQWKNKQLITITHRLLTSQSNNEDYDVIIAGGGLVGGAMACALGKSRYLEKKKILMLEGRSKMKEIDLKNPPSNYDCRVCAISPGNVEFLKDINSWDNVSRKCSVNRMQIWDACSDVVTHFNKHNMSESLCWIVENNLLQASLNQTIDNELSNNVSVKYNSTLTDCFIPNNYARSDTRTPLPPATVTLSDGTVLRTKLLIAADGDNSFISRCLNMNKLKWNYNQHAVVATLNFHEPCDNFVAWQRFLPSGPIALLPLSNTSSSLVWSTSRDHAEELKNISTEDFVNQINNAFWKEYPRDKSVEMLQEMTQTCLNLFTSDESSISSLQYPPSISGVQGGVFSFPLGFSHSDEYVRPRLAFIGDAIHRIHPLAGQGLNLGMRDVKSLLDVVETSLYNGMDIGSLESLLRYESDRQRGNLPMLTAVDGIKKLYSTDKLPAVVLRTVGSIIFNRLEPIKREVFSYVTL
uniref:Ubiquinone biosynthesis monooxygenase COQ6, mitochondrial n=1 Tax=Ciona intestinalis TaxID=7719 RepID=F7B5Q2_CIOIN